LGMGDILERNFPSVQLEVAENEKEALDVIRLKTIDLMMVSLNMPNTNLIEIIEFAKSVHPKIVIMILTMDDESIYASRYYRMGVKGLINKSEEEMQIVHAIKTAMDGNVYLNNELMQILCEIMVKEKMVNPFDLLSTREYQVVEMMLKGRKTFEIAEVLKLKISTVTTYKSRVFAKLEIANNNMIELMRLAIQYKVFITNHGDQNGNNFLHVRN
jgi:DNA-binding NarL/FixJ family response regulator